MPKQISATEAKNNFGGLLHDVAVLGRVDVLRHGRLVAVVLSPRTLGSLQPDRPLQPSRARAVRVADGPGEFDEE